MMDISLASPLEANSGLFSVFISVWSTAQAKPNINNKLDINPYGSGEQLG